MTDPDPRPRGSATPFSLSFPLGGYKLLVVRTVIMALNENDAPGGTTLKSDSDYVEEKDVAVNADPARFLSESHSSYLMQRHGTVDLDPIPSMDPADPYNWPLWKVSACK